VWEGLGEDGVETALYQISKERQLDLEGDLIAKPGLITKIPS